MPRWTKDQVEQLLAEKGWPFSTKEIQNGIQYTLADDTRVNWYTTGRVVIGGKASASKAEAGKLFQEEPKMVSAAAQPTPATDASPPHRVFIVYGHDSQAREELELILRRLRLEPIVLQNIPAGGDTIIEKLETLTGADFACVLLTPDDQGHRYGQSDEIRPRARQNVVLELGMVLAKLGRKQVAVLVKGDELERPSDIEGLIYLHFRERVDETKNHLAANLQKAGFPIQVEDLLP